MTTISPWINFNGNAEEAFTFYKSVFGGELTAITRFKDIETPEFPISEEDANKIMRIALPINGGGMLIGNDVPSFMGEVSENEHRSKIHIAAGSKEEAERITNALSVGGQIEVMSDGASDQYFSMFRDQYGLEWVVESATAA